MAIEKGHSNTMNNLGYHYDNPNDFNNILKYYLMQCLI
jgi:hypothetical protein